jgi:hypothetical protein
VINVDDRFGYNANRTSQYLACSGLKSTDILKKQVPYVETDVDVILLSAGGNDVQLGEVLDSCIFQWKRGGSDKCEAALNHSQALIDTELSGNIDALLNALLPKLSPAGKIYYPGYAQFFGYSKACDNVTWSVWERMAEKDKQKLTRPRRVQMNSMVSQVNDKIREAVIRAGPRVTFIDWDWTFAKAHGRFCEEAVQEPAPNRAGLLFYEWNTLDDGDDPSIVHRPGDPVPNKTFEGDIGKWVLETLRRHPDWEFGPAGTKPLRITEEQINAAIEKQNEFKIEMGFDDLIFWFLPDSWKRVFHPRALGHRIIADMVLHEMGVERAKVLGMEIPPNPWNSSAVVADQSKVEL